MVFDWRTERVCCLDHAFLDEVPLRYLVEEGLPERVFCQIEPAFVFDFSRMCQKEVLPSSSFEVGVIEVGSYSLLNRGRELPVVVDRRTGSMWIVDEDYVASARFLQAQFGEKEHDFDPHRRASQISSQVFLNVSPRIFLACFQMAVDHLSQLRRTRFGGDEYSRILGRFEDTLVSLDRDSRDYQRSFWWEILADLDCDE